MSRRVPTTDARVQALQHELASLREAAIQTQIEAHTQEISPVAKAQAGEAFEALTMKEQAAASLGVQPEAFKPIGFMNKAHYETLRKSNALDDTLVRRIEAFREVASAS